MKKRKKSFIIKNDFFFFGAEILKGYSPICIVREKKKKFCIAENEACRCLGCIAIGWRLYCKKGRWGAGERVGARAGRAWGAQVAAGRRARRQLAAGARADTAWARRGARLGARCVRGTAGLGVAWALDGCAGWASFGALCTWLSFVSVFGPDSTRYFPESPNEHCSL